MGWKTRFDAKVDRSGDCHVWTAGTNRSGYGTLGIDGTSFLAHRLAYAEAHGPIPDGLLVRHKCDNPPCVNPDHLELGTHQDNRDDCVTRGRMKVLHGADHGRALLDEQQVLDIRRRSDNGEGCVALGREYGVSHRTISRIKHRQTWAHI